MRLNRAGLDLIVSFEGFRSESYQDAGGTWTIGYGHTSLLRTPPHPVVAGMKITEGGGPPDPLS